MMSEAERKATSASRPSGASRWSAIGQQLSIPAIEVPGWKVAFFATAGFITVHLCLARAVKLIIDIDELQYGELGIAFLDGLIHQISLFNHGRFLESREGFYVMLGPLVTPFFGLLGVNLATLQTAFVVFAGSWAAGWSLAARRMAPQAPVWAVIALFVFATPFVSRYSVSPIAMAVHMGVSSAHGLTLAILLHAMGRRAWLTCVAAGLVAGLGTYGGIMMAVLLPGMVLGAFVAAGYRGLVGFCAGLVPGLVLAFPSEFVANGLSAQDLRAAFGLSGYLRSDVDYSRPLEALLYAPGVAAPSNDANFLASGWIYFGFIGAAYAYAAAVGTQRRERMVATILFSAACLLLAISRIGHTWFSDSALEWNTARYSAPLLPIATVLALVSSSRLASAGRRGARSIPAALLLFHLGGTATHISPHRLFEEPISTRWIRPHTPHFVPLAFPFESLPESPRSELMAMRFGRGAYLLDGGDVRRLEARAIRNRLQGRSLDDYWRGVGRAHVQGREAADWNAHLANTLTEEQRELFWQGVGMEFHTEDYQDSMIAGLERVLPTSPASLSAFAWGWGRACAKQDHVPDLLPDLRVDRRLGRRVRWELDLAADGAPRLTDEELESLTFVRWSP